MIDFFKNLQKKIDEDKNMTNFINKCKYWQLIIFIVMIIYMFAFGGKKGIDRDIKGASNFKTVITESYIDGEFKKSRVKLEENLTYDVYAEKNEIIIEYNGFNWKGFPGTKVYIIAEKTENGFDWRCFSYTHKISKRC